MADGASSLLPLRMISRVTRGYGRGSSDLGIPTANLDRSVIQAVGKGQASDTPAGTEKRLLFDDLPTGIYWGYGRVEGGSVYTAAISIGYNPTYKNGTSDRVLTVTVGDLSVILSFADRRKDGGASLHCPCR
jgi:riboflavin kinase